MDFLILFPSVLFIFYFWLCCVFFAVQAFSSCVQRGRLFVVRLRFLIAVTSLVVEHGL